MTAPDPLAHLITALRDADAGQLRERLLGELGQIAELIAIHNQAASAAATARLRAQITSRMTALVQVTRYPLQVDVRLYGRVAIPEAVLREAAAAADVLIRLTTRPFGSPAWTDYHQRFRRRYGPGALVPVKELVSDAGLGYPDGYLGTPGQRPAWRMLTDRDAAFLALIQRATLTGATEISLTDLDVKQLTIGDHRDVIPPPRIEIGVSLRASSTGAIDQGDFELWLTAAPRTPTSMAGRFTHLLTGTERDHAAPEPDDGTLTVQVSFTSRVPHNENVTRVPPLTPAVLPLGEHPPTHNAISVDDLAVTADAAKMYLIDRPTGRRVIPQIPHALDLKAHTPPLARFIAEVADARTATFGPLDPGTARALPHIPRIRYRRTILAPARWLLPAGIVTPIQNDSAPLAHLTSWLHRHNVPPRIVFCADEQRLPLDLASPLDRALLLASLERARTAELREDVPPDGNGWLNGRPAELLVPLTLTPPPPRPVPVTASPGRTHRPGSSPIVCAKITGNPARFDDIIGHLPDLMTRLDALTRRWWLRRHRDMIHPSSSQYVAVLIRLRNPADFAAAAAGLAAFAADLEARALPADLTLASYTEHPGRYGQGAALDAAEDVFAADTTAAITQIAMTTTADVPGQALAAASMARIAAAFAPNPESGYQALTSCLEQGSGPLDRAIRYQACRLADPSGNFRAVRALPSGDAVAAAWGRRDAALAAYHETLSVQRDPGTMLRTLLHEHHMRALGLDPDYERQTGRHARAAALQRLALAGRT